MDRQAPVMNALFTGRSRQKVSPSDEGAIVAATDRGHSLPVYLCQVGENVSCGACCGLYNVSPLGRDALQERLERRTQRFAAVPRTEAAIEAFQRQIEGWTPEDRPLAQFHHCPFVGLLGTDRSRVGCLLHPEAPGNHGRDWRCLSYYGAQACRTYFCPTCRVLPVSYLTILRDLMDDWYAYGLIVSEHRLQKALFEALEQRLGRPLQSMEAARPAVRRRLQDLFDIKQSWPYRGGDGPGLCHCPFDNGLYERPAMKWPSDARPAPCFQVVFRELESVFASEEELCSAVRWLDRRLDGLADCLRTPADSDPAADEERMPPRP